MDQKNQIQVYTPCEQDEINHFGLLSSKRRIIFLNMLQSLCWHLSVRMPRNSNLDFKGSVRNELVASCG